MVTSGVFTLINAYSLCITNTIDKLEFLFATARIYAAKKLGILKFLDSSYYASYVVYEYTSIKTVHIFMKEIKY